MSDGGVGKLWDVTFGIGLDSGSVLGDTGVVEWKKEDIEGWRWRGGEAITTSCVGIDGGGDEYGG